MQRADQHGEDRRRGAHRLQQRAADFRPREPAAGEPDQERAAGAHAAGFGRREQAAIEAADDEDEKQQRRPDVAQRRKPLRPGMARAGRKEFRPHAADDHDRDHVHRRGQQARE